MATRSTPDMPDGYGTASIHDSDKHVLISRPAQKTAEPSLPPVWHISTTYGTV